MLPANVFYLGIIHLKLSVRAVYKIKKYETEYH